MSLGRLRGIRPPNSFMWFFFIGFFLSIFKGSGILGPKDTKSSTISRKHPSRDAIVLVQNQARKRNPNLNFLVRIFSGGVGVFHPKGWGPKRSVCPSKPGKSNFFGGISRDFAGISRGCPKSLRKKGLGSIFGPYKNACKNARHDHIT